MFRDDEQVQPAVLGLMSLAIWLSRGCPWPV